MRKHILRGLPNTIMSIRFGALNIYLIFIFMLSIVSNTFALDTLEINAKTRAVRFDGKLKAGKFLQIIIKDYEHASFESLTITYTADEYVNTRGVEKFSSLNIEKAEVAGNNSFPLLPILIQDKDKAVFTISLFKGTEKIDEQVYSYRVSGGVKFDVSTGAFVTGLRDESYTITPVSDSTNQINREKNGDFRVGTGILAHLHLRTRSWITVGICGGFELNSDARIGYLAGGSVFLGYDRKFVISVGVVASKRSVLSAAYSTVDPISRDITTVPMVDEWAEGWFWGLTYNF